MKKYKQILVLRQQWRRLGVGFVKKHQGDLLFPSFSEDCVEVLAWESPKLLRSVLEEEQIAEGGCEFVIVAIDKEDDRFLCVNRGTVSLVLHAKQSRGLLSMGCLPVVNGVCVRIKLIFIAMWVLTTL